MKNNSVSQILGFWFGNLGKKTLTDITIPLARDNLPGLISNLTSNSTNKLRKAAARAGKRFLNEDMNYVIKNIK